MIVLLPPGGMTLLSDIGTFNRTVIRSMMGLNRGVQCLAPCPRCLVLQGDQGDFSLMLKPRTVAGTRATLLEARGERYAKDAEEILKAAGLRDIDVMSSTFLLLYSNITNDIPCRTSSGGSQTRIRMAPYLLIGSILSQAAYFTSIYGPIVSNRTLSN